MQIAPNANRTIALIARNSVSDLRLRGATPRRVVQPKHVQAADAARVVPAADPTRRDWPHVRAFRPPAWPEQMTGRLPERPDNRNMLPPVPIAPMMPGSNADELGRRVDLYI
mgnify:FL=1